MGQGGADGDSISAYVRNPNSGSQELMENLVMRDDHAAVLLRDWLLSAEGQAVVLEGGYVPAGQS